MDSSVKEAFYSQTSFLSKQEPLRDEPEETNAYKLKCNSTPVPIRRNRRRLQLSDLQHQSFWLSMITRAPPEEMNDEKKNVKWEKSFGQAQDSTLFRLEKFIHEIVLPAMKELESWQKEYFGNIKKFESQVEYSTQQNSLLKSEFDGLNRSYERAGKELRNLKFFNCKKKTELMDIEQNFNERNNPVELKRNAPEMNSMLCQEKFAKIPKLYDSMGSLELSHHFGPKRSLSTSRIKKSKVFDQLVFERSPDKSGKIFKGALTPSYIWYRQPDETKSSVLKGFNNVYPEGTCDQMRQCEGYEGIVKKLKRSIFGNNLRSIWL
jgi:hypothetical protein